MQVIQTAKSVRDTFSLGTFSLAYDADESEWDEYYEEVLDELYGTEYEDEWEEYEDFGSDPYGIFEDLAEDIWEEYEEEVIPFDDLDDIIDWYEDDPYVVGGIGILIGTGIGVAIEEDYIDSVDIPEIDLLDDEWYDWEYELDISGEWDWEEELLDIDFDYDWTYEGDDFDINIDIDLDIDWYYEDEDCDLGIGVEVEILY